RLPSGGFSTTSKCGISKAYVFSKVDIRKIRIILVKIRHGAYMRQKFASLPPAKLILRYIKIVRVSNGSEYFFVALVSRDLPAAAVLVCVMDQLTIFRVSGANLFEDHVFQVSTF